MAISKKRGVSADRSRPAGRMRRKTSSKRRILTPQSFTGDGALPSVRRKLARGAQKVSPKLNREIA